MGDILSQDDLDALLGDLFSTKAEDHPVPNTEIREVDISVAEGASETLSQDDIDKLLAEFGK